MKIKSLVSLVLSLMMIFTMITVVSATNVDDITDGNIMIARFEDSEQLKNKATNEDIINDYSLSFSLGEGGLSVQGEIESEEFLISSVLITKNKRNTSLSYSAISSNEVYNILYVCVDKEIDKFVFLDDFVDNIDDCDNVIKLYMQEKNTGNYIIIEIYIEYDFVGNYISNNNVTYDEKISSDMFSWFTNHIDAENGTEVVGTRASTSRRFKRKYIIGAETLYYNLVLDFVSNVRNVPINGTSVSDVYIEVVTSNISLKDGTEMEPTQSELRLKNVNVSFATMPNTFVKSQNLIYDDYDEVNTVHWIELRNASATSALSVVTNAQTTCYQSKNFFPSGTDNGIRLTSTGYVDLQNRTNYVDMYEEGERYGFSVTVKDMVGVATSGQTSAGFTFLVSCDEDFENDSTEHVSLYATQTVS